MAYIVKLNDKLIFDSSIKDDSFLLTRAILEVEANAAGTFEFDVPRCNQYYGMFRRLIDKVYVYRDDALLWTGRVYSITDLFNGQQNITCEGVMAVLTDTAFRPGIYEDSLADHVWDILGSHNTQVEENKMVYLYEFEIDNDDIYRDYQNYETSITRIKTLQQSFGGYMIIDSVTTDEFTGLVDEGIVDMAIVDLVGERTGLVLDWVESFTNECNQPIELRSNMINLNRINDSENIATIIIPLGSDIDGKRVTIESVNGGYDYLTADQAYIDLYGKVTRIVIWPEVEEAATLLRKGQEYLAQLVSPVETITVTAIDLADAGYDVESFHVGQMITVNSAEHGINNIQLPCVSQTFNLLYIEQNKLELGTPQIGYVEAQLRR